MTDDSAKALAKVLKKRSATATEIKAVGIAVIKKKPDEDKRKFRRKLRQAIRQASKGSASQAFDTTGSTLKGIRVVGNG
jgi:hypothetical protein